MPVRFARRSADPVANVDATRIPVITMMTPTNFRAPVPRYFEMISGIVNPSLRRDMNPEKKSWTAPMNIVPSTIHKNAAGPNKAPCMAPKIGPRPAMLRK